MGRRGRGANAASCRNRRCWRRETGGAELSSPRSTWSRTPLANERTAFLAVGVVRVGKRELAAKLRNLLTIKSSVYRDESEWLRLAGRGGKMHDVLNPDVSEDRLHGLKDRLGTLLQMQL